MFAWKNQLKIAKAMGRGDYTSVILHLKEHMEAKGEDPETLSLIAYCYERLNEPDPALCFAERALALNPHHLSSLQIATRYYLAHEDFEHAYVYACRALERPPETLPRLPSSLNALIQVPFKLLAIFVRKTKKADFDSNKAIERLERNTSEWLAWAERWKAWYESRSGGPPALH